MKLLRASIVLTFLCFGFPASAQWSPVIQITQGQSDDRNPSLVHSKIAYSFPEDEWLAFSRANGSGGRSICVMKTRDNTTAWSDSVTVIGTDTAQNDYPVLARTEYGFERQLMLVWQELLSSGRSRLFYSMNPGDGNWSNPQVVLPGSADDRSPCLSPCDTTCQLAWVRNGVVLYSLFSNNSWAPPETVSAYGDSVTGSPQVVQPGSQVDAMVVWEKSQTPGGKHAIMFSGRSATGWSAPDTVAWSADNRRPRIAKRGSSLPILISYESNRTGDWEIYEASAYPYNGGFSWSSKGRNTSRNPASEDREASLTFPVCLTLGPCITAATWRVSTSNTDSIAIVTSYDWTSRVYRSAGPSAVNRNPDISLGVPSPPHGMIFWCIWESNATGTWKLFGTYAQITLLGIDESQNLPSTSLLYQNYPNPFNPKTTIKFELSRASYVSLTVYDMLGRMVSVLVNERRQAGIHEVKFDGANLSSGVYIYKIQAGDFVQTRKLLLLR